MRKETKLFREYARQAFEDTLTLYLHGTCCDIDVETGPRQMPSRYLRRRLELLISLFPPPEVLANAQNVEGLTPAQAAAMGVSGTVATNGQVGNLGLTAAQEADLVSFLQILTDGYGPITPVSFP